MPGLEQPPKYIDEVSVYCCNSYETKESVKQKREVKHDILIRPNAVSEKVYKYNKQLNSTIKKICIVSNHVIPELYEVRELARQNNIIFDIYGTNNKIVDITPEVLINYDVVITIGRTVQYAFAFEKTEIKKSIGVYRSNLSHKLSDSNNKKGM